MARISTEYGEIGFEQAGGGDAVPIVFLHGVGSDKSVWRRQLEHFGTSRRAIAFDYPGYGDSDPAANASRDDFAQAAPPSTSARLMPAKR
jgi:3-oxoadipate enol-lactonase